MSPDSVGIRNFPFDEEKVDGEELEASEKTKGNSPGNVTTN
jgi:hypothetical protein